MNESALKLYYRNESGAWVEMPVTARDVDANWIEAANVTRFSEWTMGNNSPSAVRVRVFKVRSGS